MMLAPTCADPDVMVSPQHELRRLEELHCASSNRLMLDYRDRFNAVASVSSFLS
jgi:hypothetical protein